MSRHLVHFYNGSYPADEAGQFIAAGLAAGDECIAVLTAAHLEALESALNTHRMFDTPGAQHSGSYLSIDTDALLLRLVVNGQLDHAQAAETLRVMLTPTSLRGRGRVRAVGDLGPSLLAAGHEAAALAIESMVDRLAELHAASIFCAYPVAHFHREGHPESMLRLSGEHTAIRLPEQGWVEGFVPAPTIVPESKL